MLHESLTFLDWIEIIIINILIWSGGIYWMYHDYKENKHKYNNKF